MAEESDQNSENQEEIGGSEDLDVFVQKVAAPGVIYISFLPPKMTPLHIRQIFEKYGEVGRIFLQPEEHKFSKKKIRPKYNKGSFTEGWLEMADKKIAKRIVHTFHNTLMEDGKRSKFADYTWNLKYLHRFRWGHLTERLAHEREVRKQKMRVEYSQAKRETAAFIANVEAGKRLSSIKQRREKRGDEWQEKRRVRQFKQRKTVEEMRLEKLQKLTFNNQKATSQTDTVHVEITKDFEPKKTDLSKIFGR